MNFIKKAFDKKEDEDLHLQFMKFSKGEFRNRAIINAKRVGEKYTINTSSEFANELVKEFGRVIKEKTTRVMGAIVSTSDLTGEIDFKEKKQFQGVKRYLIDKEMSGKEILEIVDKFPKSFFGLSFEMPNGDKLKIKPKAPKSGKPGKGDAAPKADFCKLITTDKNLGGSFVFEKPDFKKAEIKHTFFIEKIEIPESLKKSEDFALIRERSIRIGKILREGIIDEVPTKREFEFRA